MTGIDQGEALAALAASLTRAQRMWLSNAEPTLERVPKQPCEEWWDAAVPLYVTVNETDHWLGSKGMCSPEGETTFTSGFEQLTPLGLALREHIQTNMEGERS